MFALLIIIHLIVSVILMLVVLLQSGKAGDLASAFGGASSQTAFGARGATTMLTKVTAACAVIFMLTSLGLAIMYSQQTGTSVMEDFEQPAETQTVPETTPPPSPPEENQ